MACTYQSHDLARWPNESEAAPAAPTEAALRAAKAVHPMPHHPPVGAHDMILERQQNLAMTIDRETGLPELLAALKTAERCLQKSEPMRGSRAAMAVDEVQSALARAQGREGK